MALHCRVSITQRSPLAALKHTVPEMWAPILIILEAQIPEDAPARKKLLLMLNKNVSPIPLTNVTMTMFTGMILAGLEKIRSKNVALVDGQMNTDVQVNGDRENT